MIIAVLALFGIIFGSFVNALVWRLHEQETVRGKKGKAARKQLRELSIAKGRSMCPSCRHTLEAKDLVPVASWLWLHGKCRYCSAAISWQYPIVELLTGALFVLSYLMWPLDLHGVGLFQLIVWLIFVVAFVALAIYDLRWFLLPDRIVYPLVWLAVAETLVVVIWQHNLQGIWEPVLSATIIFGLFWGLYQVSKGAWIGGGDVKLALVLGLLAGTPLRAFLLIFFASLLGTFASIPLLMHGKGSLKVRIPFGPYLLASSVIIMLCGADIVQWYNRILLGA